jgi:hypothetical protein
MRPMLTDAPISLSDEQLNFVMEILKPLEPPERTAFLEALVVRLRLEQTIGDGNLYRICRELLRAGFFSAPILSAPQPSGLLRGSRLKSAAPIP